MRFTFKDRLASLQELAQINRRVWITLLAAEFISERINSGVFGTFRICDPLAFFFRACYCLHTTQPSVGQDLGPLQTPRQPPPNICQPFGSGLTELDSR
jgi:hypothetical protein